MKKPQLLAPFFVISTDDNKNIVKVVEAISLEDGKEIAHNASVGCVNHVVGTLHTVDRVDAPAAEVAEEAMQFLWSVVEGRNRTSSPQCLPVAQYKKLVELAGQYKRAKSQELSNEK